MKNIAFIGLGVMGEAMAARILAKGYNLKIYTRTKAKAAALIDAGASWCETPKDAADGADAVITIVGYPKDVEEVYFANDGILAAVKKDAVLIDMTTSEPALAIRIYDEAKAKGAYSLDAPVSGGDIGAKNGTLSIMVGGDEVAFNKCMELFECMGKTITLAGKAGAGQHTKMANQIAVGGALAGVCEAIAYGEAAKLDIDTMLRCISGGAAGSWQMTNNGPKIAVRDDSPGFFIKHFIKDMRIAKREAEENGLTLKVLDDIIAMYEEMVSKDESVNDIGTQALIRAYKD